MAYQSFLASAARVGGLQDQAGDVVALGNPDAGVRIPGQLDFGIHGGRLPSWATFAGGVLFCSLLYRAPARPVNEILSPHLAVVSNAQSAATDLDVGRNK